MIEIIVWFERIKKKGERLKYLWGNKQKMLWIWEANEKKPCLYHVRIVPLCHVHLFCSSQPHFLTFSFLSFIRQIKVNSLQSYCKKERRALRFLFVFVGFSFVLPLLSIHQSFCFFSPFLYLFILVFLPHLFFNFLHFKILSKFYSK